MNELALLVAATLSSGTPLAIAGLGLLLNERAGILNLGAEGIMLVAAVAGFATGLLHRQRGGRRCVAGAGAGALVAARARLAGHLAQHQPVRHRPGAQPLRLGLLGLRGHPLRRQEAGGDQPTPFVPLLRRHPAPGAGPLPPAPDGLPGHGAHGRRRSPGGSSGPAPAWSCAPSARRRCRPTPSATRCAASGWRRWWPAGRSAASPGPTSRWSTRRSGWRGWWRGAAGSRWRSPPSPPGGPARLLLGAYLFGGVTMLQLSPPGRRRPGAAAVHVDAALPRHRGGAGPHLAATRPGSGSTCRPPSASPSSRRLTAPAFPGAAPAGHPQLPSSPSPMQHRRRQGESRT